MLNHASNQIERNITEDVIDDRVVRDLFRSDEEDYYEPVRIDNAFSGSCIEYESKAIEVWLYQLKNILI